MIRARLVKCRWKFWTVGVWSRCKVCRERSFADRLSLKAFPTGPEAAKVLQAHVKEDLGKLYFGQSGYFDVAGVKCHVARGGYTGEDGFEVSLDCWPRSPHILTLPQISIPPEKTVEITELISKSPVQLTGLGARDSLRLEAGMCLYGHDLNEDITPVEAGLSWVIGLSLRTL